MKKKIRASSKFALFFFFLLFASALLMVLPFGLLQEKLIEDYGNIEIFAYLEVISAFIFLFSMFVAIMDIDIFIINALDKKNKLEDYINLVIKILLRMSVFSLIAIGIFNYVISPAIKDLNEGIKEYSGPCHLRYAVELSNRSRGSRFFIKTQLIFFDKNNKQIVLSISPSLHKKLTSNEDLSKLPNKSDRKVDSIIYNCSTEVYFKYLGDYGISDIKVY